MCTSVHVRTTCEGRCRNTSIYGTCATPFGGWVGPAGLRQCVFFKQWLVNGSAFLTGRSFVNCVMLKGSMVYTALRAFIGRIEASTRCDACNNVESIGHILQMCHRSHDDRVNRHDSINKALTALLSKGW